MKLNIAPAFGALSQGLDNAASIYSQSQDRKWSLLQQVKQDKYNVDSTNAHLKLENYVANWNLENSQAMQSDSYNFEDASQKLQDGLASFFSENQSEWFGGDDDVANRFAAEVFEPYTTQMHTTLLNNEAKNIMNRTKGKANNTIATLMDSLGKGADAAGIWANMEKVGSSYANAAMLSSEERAVFNAELKTKYNEGAFKSSINSIIDQDIFTTGEIIQIAEAVQDPTKIDQDTAWGQAALGIAAEIQYDEGLSPFTGDQFDAIKKTAKARSLAKGDELTAVAVEASSKLMAEGLDSGILPSSVMAQIAEGSKDMDVQRATLARDAALQVQAKWATDKGYELWNADKDGDMEHLKKQRESISSGLLSLTTFDGIPTVQSLFLKMYDAQIKAIETANKGLTTAQVTQNKQIMDSIFEKLKAGTISPVTAIQAVSGISGNTPEEYKDDLYEMELINKIKDNIVPEAYKPSATKFMSEMESLKYGVTKNKELTVVQTEQIAQARIWTNESIASLFMNTAANTMSMDQFTKALGEIKQTFIGKSIAALESGVVMDKFSLFNDPTSLDDALDKNQQFGAMGSSPVILTNNGQIQWAKPEMKKTYDAIASEVTEQLRSQFDITTTSAPSPLMIDGKPYPVPVFQGKGKDWKNTWYFAVDQGDIFASSDGKNWQQWQKFDTVAKFKETTPVNEFFNKFRTVPVQTKKEARVQDYQDKEQSLDPDGKHKQL